MRTVAFDDLESAMGQYVESTLLKDEKVVFETRLHPIIFLPGALIISGAPLVLDADRNLVAGAVVVALTGALFLLSAFILRATSEFAVSNKRVIIKTGWLSRRTIEMNLSKVESVDVSQGILGRIFGYGRIVVVGTGATREPFSDIASPMEFRRAIQSQSA